MSYTHYHVLVLGTPETHTSCFTLDSREGWNELIIDDNFVYCFENKETGILMRYPKTMTCVTIQVVKEQGE